MDPCFSAVPQPQHQARPLLVDVEVTTDDGETHRSTRPVTAVCRCGASARGPWCDGTHKLLDRGT